MDYNEQITEGDVNFSEERIKWDNQISDSTTRRILDDDSRYFLHQAMSTPCLDVLDLSCGSYIKTISGHEMLDFHGNSVHQIGYGNEILVARILEQIDRLPFSPRRYTNIAAVELAKMLASLLPGDLNRSLFAPGGTTVVGIAIKLARVVTGKHKLISMWDSFHGASLDSISAGGEASFKKHMGPLMPGVINIPPPSSYRGIFGKNDTDQVKYADYLEYVIENEGEIGAVIAETIRNTDVEIPSIAYWRRVREICNKHNILLILDEIPIALGRTGKMFAFEHFGIEPDIICLGKGLGGGIIPFAAMVTRDIYNIAGDISLGHYTHEKSPAGCAAALATIDIINSQNLAKKALKEGEWIRCKLQDLKNEFQSIGDIRGRGFLWAIELVENQETKERATILAEKIMYECMRTGLSFKISHGNIILLSPALTISKEELIKAFSILRKALAKYCRPTELT